MISLAAFVATPGTVTDARPALALATPAKDTAVLNVRLSAGYGTVETLHDVALAVLPGERLGVVGSSGAGKSTLAAAALGLLPWRGGWAKGSVQNGGGANCAATASHWCRKVLQAR